MAQGSGEKEVQAPEKSIRSSKPGLESTRWTPLSRSSEKFLFYLYFFLSEKFLSCLYFLHLSASRNSKEVSLAVKHSSCDQSSSISKYWKGWYDETWHDTHEKKNHRRGKNMWKAYLINICYPKLLQMQNQYLDSGWLIGKLDRLKWENIQLQENTKVSFKPVFLGRIALYLIVATVVLKSLLPHMIPWASLNVIPEHHWCGTPPLKIT